MSDNRLSVRIGGRDEDIDAQALITILEETIALLRDLDARMNEGRHTVRWLLASASKNSPLESGFRGEPISSSNGPLLPIASVLISSLDELERGVGRPEYFSDAMLDRATRISRTVGRRVGGVSYRNGLDKTVAVTGFTAANAIKYQLPDTYTSHGELEGRLDQITAHGDRNEFCIYDPLTKRPIACEFEPEDLDRVLKAMKARVRVTGLITYRRKGHEARKVRVHHWREIAPAISLAEVHAAGIDLTRGRPAADVIHALRAANAG